MRDDEDKRFTPYSGPPDLSDEPEGSQTEGAPPGPSLTDDLMALLDDGKTYAEAELAYQRTRLRFSANRIKGIVGFGLAAFGVFHLALIALAVGLVLALIPLVGPWAATAIVTVALIGAGLLLLSLVKSRIDAIRDAFSERSGDEPS